VCGDGQEMAVKLLYDNIQKLDDEQFIREFQNLMMLKHPNIVRLVGYCYDTQRGHANIEKGVVFVEKTHKILCFEYMRGRSLQDRLSGMRPLHFKFSTYIPIKQEK
jgi:serine/threonine protein kinase